MAAPQAHPGTLEWVRPPRQARSQLTLGRILDAAESLLREKCWEDTSVADIVRRADSSVGAFYARFRDKDALLSALHERFVEEAIATAEHALCEKRWAGSSISEIVRELVAFQVRIQDQHAGLARAIVLRSAECPEFRDRGLRMTASIDGLFARLVVARRREILHPIPIAAAAFTSRLIGGAMLQRLLFPAAANLASPELSLVGELTHAALAYLGVFPEDAVDAD